MSNPNKISLTFAVLLASALACGSAEPVPTQTPLSSIEPAVQETRPTARPKQQGSGRSLKEKGSKVSAATITLPIDPCSLTTQERLFALIEPGIARHFPLTHGREGEKLTLSEPQMLELTCPGTGIEMRAKLRYRDTKGLVQFSASGKVRFGGQVVANVTFKPDGEGNVEITRAEACLTGFEVRGLDLRNVPNWIDSTLVRKMLNDKLEEPCFDITALVRAFLGDAIGSWGSSAEGLTEEALLRGLSLADTNDGTPEHSARVLTRWSRDPWGEASSPGIESVRADTGEANALLLGLERRLAALELRLRTVDDRIAELVE